MCADKKELQEFHYQSDDHFDLQIKDFVVLADCRGIESQSDGYLIDLFSF